MLWAWIYATEENMPDQSRPRSTTTFPIGRLQHGDNEKCATGTKAEIKLR